MKILRNCPVSQFETEKAPVSGMREGERKCTRRSRRVNSWEVNHFSSISETLGVVPCTGLNHVCVHFSSWLSGNLFRVGTLQPYSVPSVSIWYTSSIEKQLQRKPSVRGTGGKVVTLLILCVLDSLATRKQTVMSYRFISTSPALDFLPPDPVSPILPPLQTLLPCPLLF